MPKMSETKQKFLSTASKLFQIQGYHGTGIQQIIKESGCPAGSLYYYFPDGKEQLVEEAIHMARTIAVQEMKEAFARHEHVNDALNELLLIGVNVDISLPVEGFPLTLIALETSNMSERIRLACKTAYDQFIELLCEKCIQSGWPKEEAEDIAYIIVLMIEGCGVQVYVNQSTEPLVRTHRLIMEIVSSRWEALQKK